MELMLLELINNEKESFGFYLSNHPTILYKERYHNIINLIDIKKYFNKNISIIVMIDKIKEIKTKKGDVMAFINGSDEETDISIIVFPNVYKDLSNIKKGDIIKIDGKVERKDTYNVIANKIEKVKEDL